MAHKPKYAKQEPRRNTALKLLPLVLAAIVAVVLIIKTVGGKSPRKVLQRRWRPSPWSRSPPPPWASRATC